jgi:dihydroneopterin aldolase
MSSQADSIRLSGLRVFARHGVLEQEQESGQTFVIDVELFLDLSRAAASDRLSDTVDYGDLARRVNDAVTTERWDLIERVAQRVADLVLEDEMVSRVQVTIHKPQAPIGLEFGDVAVTLTRERG